ncbi:MAG: glycosyltransferase family protein, partial [Candidatus Dormibacteria bacterium]
TESELDWTLEHLGHRVVKLQENELMTHEVVSAVRERGTRLFIYVHTHGWGQTGNITPIQMVEQIRASGIRTASFHLDRFFGLNSLDGRQDRIGDHAFFKTDMLFSADGEDDQRWTDRGIRHHWLLPGVVSRGCFFGKPSPEFGNQVIFAGSDSYHPEYPFRNRMVSQLKEVYGSNFRIYQGIRQDRLNSLYATAKVVVGDHCFAGVPRYISDRLFETAGRGGFIIYPETEGVTSLIPGLVTYKPQDLVDLRKKIDYFLADENQKERIERRNEAHEWVKKNGTYDNRMIELLSVMGIQ